jgi:hypothetical protein
VATGPPGDARTATSVSPSTAASPPAATSRVLLTIRRRTAWAAQRDCSARGLRPDHDDEPCSNRSRTSSSPSPGTLMPLPFQRAGNAVSSTGRAWRVAYLMGVGTELGAEEGTGVGPGVGGVTGPGVGLGVGQLSSRSGPNGGKNRGRGELGAAAAEPLGEGEGELGGDGAVIGADPGPANPCDTRRVTWPVMFRDWAATTSPTSMPVTSGTPTAAATSRRVRGCSRRQASAAQRDCAALGLGPCHDDDPRCSRRSSSSRRFTSPTPSRRWRACASG